MVLLFKMKDSRYLTKEVVVLLYLMPFLFLRCDAQGSSTYWCSPKEDTNPGPPLPETPKIFSTRIQVNYESHGFTSEIIRKVDTARQRDYMEVKAGKRHVAYFSLGEDDSFLTVTYTPEGATCKKDQLSKIVKRSVFDEKDAGPLGILQLVQEKVLPKKANFNAQSERDFIRGIPIFSWQICEFVEELGTAVEVILYYSDPSWIPAHPRYSKIGESQIKSEIVRMKVHVPELNDRDEIRFTAEFYDYQPILLQDKDFQTPELVHCSGYSAGNKASVTLPSYFSYNSEIVRYSTSSGVAPVVSHRSVHYDFKAGLARVDYQGAGSKDSYSPLDVKVRSFIYDFNTGLEYSFEPLFGGCSIDVQNTSLDVFDATKTKTLAMLEPMTFFYLQTENNKDPLSYKGVYETRGLPTDVFSKKIWDGDKYRNFFWYFTSDRTKLIEDEVLNNILVKMVSRPETGSGSLGSEDQIEINFYNFMTEEPSSFLFDITMCFNESSAKEFVITFPGEYNILLEDTIYLFKTRVQKAIQDIAKVSRQRVSIQQIYFRSPYLLVQFKILDVPPIEGIKPVRNENRLDKAVELLQKSIKDGTFRVEVRTSENVNIVLRPEPDGFKEFQGERRAPPEEVFKESSFVGMSIGMTVLGFLLGGIVVNLVITKKYGVSLLQTTVPPSGARRFDGPLSESSM